MVVTIVFAVLTVWGWLRAGGASEPGASRYQIVLSEEERFVNYGSAITVSPDGSSIVYVGRGELAPQLWLKRRDQLNAFPLDGTDSATSPSFSPNGLRVAFNYAGRQIKAVSIQGEPPITLTDSGVGSGNIRWGRDGYVYGFGGASGGYGLVRVPETGGAVEQVTTLDTAANERLHWDPTPLPNGRGVTFTILRQSSDISENDIGLVDLRTGEHELLVHGAFATYSPTGHLLYASADGTLICVPFDENRLRITGAPVTLFTGVRLKAAGWDFFNDTATTEIYTSGSASPYGTATPVWVDRTGRASVVDPTWTFSLPFNMSLALAPDGRRLALDILGETNDIWVKRLDEGPLTRLTFEGGENTGVSWFPDGRSVIFTSNREGLQGLYQKRADGAESAEVLLAPFGHGAIYQGLWANDGEWIALRSGGQINSRDLWAFRPGIDSQPVRLLENQYDELHLDLSPDGRWLAYTSTESGRTEVYVRRFPERTQGRFQISAGGGTEPLWAHSGREIFYIDGDGNVVSAEVVTSPDIEVRGRTVLFGPSLWRVGNVNRTYYDVSPDDQRFIMIRRTEIGEEAKVILIENFFELLRENAGN
jgi:serine/threonine-protein kinase